METGSRMISVSGSTYIVPDGVSEETIAIVKATLSSDSVTDDVVDSLVAMMNREARLSGHTNKDVSATNSPSDDMYQLSFCSNNLDGRLLWSSPLCFQPYLSPYGGCQALSPYGRCQALLPYGGCQALSPYGGFQAYSPLPARLFSNMPSSLPLLNSNKLPSCTTKGFHQRDDVVHRLFNDHSCTMDKEVNDAIHRWLGNKASEQCHAPGGGAYAEVTRNSMTAIFEMLRRHNVLNCDSTVIDMGSGTGCFLFSLCQEFKCKGVGCEHQPERIRCATTYSIELIKECKTFETSRLNADVYMSFESILSLTHIPSFITLGYQFDQEFTPVVSNHLFDLYYVSGPPYILSCRASDKEKWIQNGYHLVDSVQTTKAKAKQFRSNHFYLYKRMKVIAEPICLKSEPPIVIRDYPFFTRAANYFGLSVDQKLEVLRLELGELDIYTTERKKKRKYSVSKALIKGCLALGWQQCEQPCDTCSSHFTNKYELLEQRVSEVAGYGVFATRNIPADTVLCEYFGKSVGSDVHGHDVLELPSGKRIKPPKDAIHRYFNHSHSPHANARLQKWYDGKHQRVSVVSNENITVDEEILFDYGLSKGFCTNVLVLMMARADTYQDCTKTTAQLRRDTYRCVEAEKRFGIRVYTADNRKCREDLFSTRYHTVCDINEQMNHKVDTYSEIFIDWYWYVNSYVRENIKWRFFNKELMSLTKKLGKNGFMYIPLSPSTFVRTLTAIGSNNASLKWKLLSTKEMTAMSKFFSATIAVQYNHEAISKEPHQHKHLGMTTAQLKQECSMESKVDLIYLQNEWIKAKNSCKDPIFIQVTKIDTNNKDPKILRRSSRQQRLLPTRKNLKLPYVRQDLPNW